MKLFKILLLAGIALPWSSFSYMKAGPTIKVPEIPKIPKIPEVPAAPDTPAKTETPKRVHVQSIPQKNVKPAEKPESRKPDQMEYMMPCLTVFSGTDDGNISYLPLKFIRTKEKKPLRIMIADDTPNGSGRTIHSSVWLAAVTAAMQRNDTLHGTTIVVEFSGLVDGPSAGGVTCLTILSALDGRPLPDDFAMTGTILPDGTIGAVGGIGAKMRAAAYAGKKRIFIPAFERFDNDSKGNAIDLQSLADMLGVKLYRVENIAEAYALLHRLPYTGDSYVNIREISRFPDSAEIFLKDTFEKYYRKVRAAFAKNKHLVNEKILSGYHLSPYPAYSLYTEGKLLPATIQIIHTWQAWQAWNQADKLLKDFIKNYDLSWKNGKFLREYHYRKLLFDLRAYREQLYKEKEDSYDNDLYAYYKKYFKDERYSGYFPYRSYLAEITAQFAQVDLPAVLTGYRLMLEKRLPDKNQINTADYETLNEYYNLEKRLLYLLCLQSLSRKDMYDFLATLAREFPNLKANKRAIEVEQLFYSSAIAAKSFVLDHISGKQTTASGKKSFQKDIQKSPLFFTYVRMSNLASNAHHKLSEKLLKRLAHPDYHLQASLKLQVMTFVEASALMIEYGPDRTNDFAPYLLRNARNAAIRNISECIKANIPCVWAIYELEVGDATSGKGEDKYAALMSYWRAALYSKALLMSFK